MTLSKLGRYRLKEPLGTGSRSTVYRAFDPRFRRNVAVKVLSGDLLENAGFYARFEREAQAVARLEHPALVPLYDFGEDAGHPYLVMRLMDGGTLSDRLQRGTFSLEQVAALLSRLAPALDYAHEQGVLHRDLRPPNILFDRANNPYLADFGIVLRAAANGDGFSGTNPAGTPAYMSPEQVQGKTEIDGRSDVYALGVILFQLLSGHLPYQADTSFGLAMQHITEPVPDIVEQRRDLPPACQTVITGALAKRREDRYPTAGALASAVRQLARRIEAGEEPPPVRELLPEADVARNDVASGMYRAAMAALKAEQWELAAEHLNNLLAINPNYRDTVSLLAQANRNKRMAQLWSQAQVGAAEEAWADVLAVTEQLLVIDNQHREARVLRQRAQTMMAVEEQYAIARASWQRQDWERVISALERVLALDSTFRDAQDLLQQALEARDHRRRLRQLRRQGEEALAVAAWETAIARFEESLALEPGQPDVVALLEQAVRESQAEAKAQRRQEEQEVAEVQAEEEEPPAGSEASEVAARLGDAQEWLATVNERALQTEIARLQAQAERREAAGSWADAIAYWEQALALAPRDEDLQQRLTFAREEANRQQVIAHLLQESGGQQDQPEALDESIMLPPLGDVDDLITVPEIEDHGPEPPVETTGPKVVIEELSSDGAGRFEGDRWLLVIVVLLSLCLLALVVIYTTASVGT